MSDSETQRDRSAGAPDQRTFSFNFSLGRRPPAGLHTSSPDSVERVSSSVTSFELRDGVLSVGNGVKPSLAVDLAPQSRRSGYYDPFPSLTALRTWFHRAVRLVAVAIPVSLLILGIVTGQPTDTTVFMTVFGVILSTMIVSSLVPKRTWFSEVLESMFADAARTHAEAREAQQAEPLVTKIDIKRELTLGCSTCGTRFRPEPPRAVCPECKTPALADYPA